MQYQIVIFQHTFKIFGFILNYQISTQAFGTLGAGSLLNSAFNETDKKELFYESDSTNVNQKMEELIISSVFEPFNVGGIDQYIKIEVFGYLHVFGALGKPVTLNEAKNNVSHY